MRPFSFCLRSRGRAPYSSIKSLSRRRSVAGLGRLPELNRKNRPWHPARWQSRQRRQSSGRLAGDGRPPAGRIRRAAAWAAAAIVRPPCRPPYRDAGWQATRPPRGQDAQRACVLHSAAGYGAQRPRSGLPAAARSAHGLHPASILAHETPVRGGGGYGCRCRRRWCRLLTSCSSHQSWRAGVRRTCRLPPPLCA